MTLHNRVSAAELKRQLAAETFRRITISFYQYAPIADPGAFSDQLYIALDQLQVFGRIYVAHEGINAQVSVPEHHMDAFRSYLYSIPFLDGIRLNVAVEDHDTYGWVQRITARSHIVYD